MRTIKGPSFAFDNPEAMSVSGPTVFVADENNNSVTEVTVATGRLVRVIAGEGLDAPDGISVEDGMNGLDELARDAHILGRWRRVAGRVVVRQHDGGGAVAHGVSENFARRHGAGIEQAARNFQRPADQTVFGIQQQNPERFLPQRVRQRLYELRDARRIADHRRLRSRRLPGGAAAEFQRGGDFHGLDRAEAGQFFRLDLLERGARKWP